MTKGPIIRALSAILCVAAIGGSTVRADGTVPGVDASQREPLPNVVIVGYDRVPGADQLSCVQDCVPTATGWREMVHPASARHAAHQPHPFAYVRVVQLPVGVDAEEAARRIRRLTGVRYAAPDGYTQAALEPNDPHYPTQQYGPQIIRADLAWDITTGDPNVIIAIADSGVRLDHQDFQNGAVWMNDDPVNGVDDDNNGFIDDWRGWDFIHDDNNPSPSGGHGTHVSGIATARLNDGVGMAGLTNCTLMPLQVFDGPSGTWQAIANAITYAVDNGAQVVNYSGGGFGGHPLLSDAVEYAWANDVTVVAAVGNQNSLSPHYPAAYPETIAVSATGPDDEYYEPSNMGNYVDVAAPGIDVWSTYSNSTTDYIFESGTSMASPHVAGLVGLMYSVDSTLGVEQIRSLLHASAVDLGAPGFDILFGHGRIDALGTLEGVLALDTDPPSIVHDGAATFPYSGYVDPRAESSDGVNLDLGITSLDITFSEPVRDAGIGVGGGLTIDSFVIEGTAASYPVILAVDDSENPRIRIDLSGPIPVGEWTVIVADVEDHAGNQIEHFGNQGPGVDEPDRVDLGFLPCDIDNNGTVEPLDLLRFRQIVSGVFVPPVGTAEDFADMDRSGMVQPVDLLRFRQLIAGTGDATQPWDGASLPARP